MDYKPRADISQTSDASSQEITDSYGSSAHLDPMDPRQRDSQSPAHPSGGLRPNSNGNSLESKAIEQGGQEQTSGTEADNVSLQDLSHVLAQSDYSSQRDLGKQSTNLMHALDYNDSAEEAWYDSSNHFPESSVQSN